VSRETALPDPGDGVPLSDIEWDVLSALEKELDLEGPALPAPGVVLLTLCRQLRAWLRWFLDPRFEGLPMPKLLVWGA
jgi:hypothetical protein